MNNNTTDIGATEGTDVWEIYLYQRPTFSADDREVTLAHVSFLPGPPTSQYRTFASILSYTIRFCLLNNNRFVQLSSSFYVLDTGHLDRVIGTPW